MAAHIFHDAKLLSSCLSFTTASMSVANLLFKLISVQGPKYGDNFEENTAPKAINGITIWYSHYVLKC